MVTIPLGVEEKVTCAPPAGAGVLSVTVPVVVLVTPMAEAASVIAILCEPTFTMALPGRKPGAEAVTRVLPWTPGVTVTVTLCVFAGMRTLAGSVATEGSTTPKLICWPPAPAGSVILTRNVPGAPKRFNGSGDSVMVLPLAVTVTVAGLLLVNGSLTI